MHLILTTISHAKGPIPGGCDRKAFPHGDCSFPYCGPAAIARHQLSLKRLTRCQYLKNFIFLHIKLKRIIVNQPLVRQTTTTTTTTAAVPTLRAKLATI